MHSSRGGAAADEGATRRLARLRAHLAVRDADADHVRRMGAAPCVAAAAAAQSGAAAAGSGGKVPIIDDAAAFPEPPLAPALGEGELFPKYPDMKKHMEQLGSPGMFTYKIAGGRQMTIVTDPALYKIVFFPDNVHLKANQEVLAYHWFGINKEMSQKYTTSSLHAVRKALKQSKVKVMNNTIGAGILRQMDDFGKQGTCELYDFALLTFWPVNEAMFGAETVSPARCPHIKDDLDAYNSSFELVANGMPRSMFPEMEEAAQRISQHFGDRIGEGNADKDSCPVLKARLSTMTPEDRQKFPLKDQGRLVMSIFWASQANTLPGTFWCLALALAHPEVK